MLSWLHHGVTPFEQYRKFSNIKRAAKLYQETSLINVILDLVVPFQRKLKYEDTAVSVEETNEKHFLSRYVGGVSEAGHVQPIRDKLNVIRLITSSPDHCIS